MLAREIQNIQNPALGAAMLWRFCTGYVENQRIPAPLPLHYLFLVLPVLLHKETSELVRRTYKSSGLRAFATKFGDASAAKQDLLFQIQERAVRWRKLSLQSIELAVAGKLILLEENGDVIPLSRPKAQGLSAEVKLLLGMSEKLGAWFGELSEHEVLSTLKVKL
ncbi:DUF6521 family protein [Pantoea sp. DY-15]|uniref:three component ABC system middle component n=1 Tax=Pantoea sp. DY-15 TaxID=2871489 RepID=UPI001C93C2AA|nr:three component ABC system middle component [Pantoea sp. DY-15]MBY4890721.1 DUF6521 family protein [Pantoea sp. DY-15]